MASKRTFGAVLARVRRELGFSSAYAFYRDREGHKTFKMSFRNYVKLEQGAILPKVEKLEAILQALGLRDYSAAAHDLVEAYLADSGISRLDRYRRAPGPPGSGEPAMNFRDVAVRQAVTEVAVQLNVEQWQTLAKDFAHTACFYALLDTRGGMDFSELEASTGLKAPAVRRAVKALAAAGLVEVSGKRVRTRFDEKYLLRCPPESPEMARLRETMDDYDRLWLARATLVHETAVTIRLPESRVNQLKQELVRFGDVAAMWETPGRSPDSTVYTLQSLIFRNFPPLKDT